MVKEEVRRREIFFYARVVCSRSSIRSIDRSIYLVFCCRAAIVVDEHYHLSDVFDDDFDDGVDAFCISLSRPETDSRRQAETRQGLLGHEQAALTSNNAARGFEENKYLTPALIEEYTNI